MDTVRSTWECSAEAWYSSLDVLEPTSQKTSRALLLVLFVGACSNPDPEQGVALCPDAPPCEIAESEFTVGKLEGDAVEPFPPEMTLPLEFGPQGGQHVFVDVQIEPSEFGMWDLSFELTDPDTMTAGGYAQFKMRTCDCPTQYVNRRVFVDLPEANRYVLEAQATSPSGKQLQIEPVPVFVAP